MSGTRAAPDPQSDHAQGAALAEDAVDHGARSQILQLSREQGKITATLNALEARLDRDSKAHMRALTDHQAAMKELTSQLAAMKESTAFADGKNVTRWTLLGAGVLTFFTFIGGLTSMLIQHIVGKIWP